MAGARLNYNGRLGRGHYLDEPSEGRKAGAGTDHDDRSLDAVWEAKLGPAHVDRDLRIILPNRNLLSNNHKIKVSVDIDLFLVKLPKIKIYMYICIYIFFEYLYT